MTEYILQFQVWPGSGWVNDPRLMVGEADAIDTLHRVAARSNMSWRLVKRETVETVIATANGKEAAK